MARADLTGQRFGKLVVLEQHPIRATDGAVRWVCRCDCGGPNIVETRRLRAGKTKTCGCGQWSGCTTHGQSSLTKRTQAYTAWINMKSRCETPSCKSYPWYGARGIKVCARWRYSYEAFLSDMGHPPPGMTLERDDSNGDYEPGNCRWATRKEQQRNIRTNRMLTYRGETRSMAEWAEVHQMPYERLAGRIRKGWSVEEAIEKPVDVRHQRT